MKVFSISFLLTIAFLVGCVTNPVTGKREVRLVGEDWELGVGKQQYAPLRQMQGGDYVVDPGVERYVNQVGQRLATVCLLYTSPSPRDLSTSRMPSSA